jgi:hypothetical protein
MSVLRSTAHAQLRRIPLSAADVDHGNETYISIISKILAALIALLWGASMVMAGVFGIEPGTQIATLTLGSGVVLILLAVDQLWRSVRNLS